MDRVTGAFSKKIDIIGVEHGKVEEGVREKLVLFAQSNSHVVLAGEGCAYNGALYDDEFHGIEDSGNLVSNYANLLLKYRKACSFLENRELLRPIIESLKSPDCPDNVRNLVEKNLKGQLDLLGSYMCAIFQLFMETERSVPLATAMGKVLESFTQNKTNESFVLSEFFRTIFTEKNKPYFEKSFWDPSHEPYPSECLAFFGENKASFDLIAQTIIFQLSQAIREEFSWDAEIQNHTALSETNIYDFFKEPRDSKFAAEDAAQNLRNLVFATSLNEIACRAKTEYMICVVVGNKHISGLKEILARDKIFEIGTYNVVESQLPSYLSKK